VLGVTEGGAEKGGRMAQSQQTRACTDSSVLAVPIAHPDTQTRGKPWFTENFSIGPLSWQAALGSLVYVNSPAAIEILFVQGSQRSGWISPLSHPSVISPGKTV